jgi:multidrug efflux pump
VDDAIISVEMMVVKMEQGWERVRAASFAYTTTAMPMLTGTIVTAAASCPSARALVHGRVHVLDLRGDHHRPAGVVGGLGALRPLPRLQAAARFPQGGRARGRDAVYRKPFYQRFRAWWRGASSIAGR